MEQRGASDHAGLVRRTFDAKENLISAIEELGISRNAAIRGLYYTGNVSADMAVSWIMEHLEENLDHPIRQHELSITEIEDEYDDEDIVDEEGRIVIGEEAAMEEYKMVIVVNTSLEMSSGKMAAQVGHACVGLYRQLDAVRHPALIFWTNQGEKKIVLKANSTEELLRLEQEGRSQNLPVQLVEDAGRTQIPAGSTTTLSIFGPSSRVDEVTGQLSLL